MNIAFGKILLPLITPFAKNGSVDYKRMSHLVDWLLKNNKADSIIVSGTTGEFFSLSFEERMKLFFVVREAVNRRVPMIAGTGCASTWETVKLTREAEKAGADAVMVVTPFYSRPTQEGIYQHFKAVAGVTSLPVMIYNIPLFTGSNIEPETLARLARIQNIVAVKEESGINPTQATRFILGTPKNFNVYVDDDTMVLAVLAQGGVGVVSGGAHIIGRMMRRMIDCFVAGRNREASEIHLRMFPFFEALYVSSRINPIPMLRAALELVEFNVGNPRLPLTPAARFEKKAMENVLKELASEL
jgi:4-hydroxy-tetrahydrodipicolinate synthase